MTTRTATFDRQALIACCRARLQSGQRTVRERYLCEGDAPRLLHERCQLIDGILCDLWQALELPSSLALVAVGATDAANCTQPPMSISCFCCRIHPTRP